MIRVLPHAEGCVLPVRAQPGARREGVIGEWNGALKVAVTAPPRDGRANDALVECVRRALGLRRGQLEVVRGHASRDKAFLIRGLSPAEMQSRLAGLGE